MDEQRISRDSRRAAGSAGRRPFLAMVFAIAARATPVSAAEVEPAGGRCRGKRCTVSSQCGKGLDCDTVGRCVYAKRNCGKQKDRCCASGECCGDYFCVHGSCRRRS